MHPNAFSLATGTIDSAIPASSANSRTNTFCPINASNEDLIELNGTLGLGLGPGIGTNESRELDWDWTDVLRAYISYRQPSFHSELRSELSESHPTTHNQPPTLISRSHSHSKLPRAIHELIAHVHTHSIPRNPIQIVNPTSIPTSSDSYPNPTLYLSSHLKTESSANSNSKSKKTKRKGSMPVGNSVGYGMSPKKAHEITRMAEYIGSVARDIVIGTGFGSQRQTQTPTPLYIVDVGAGQGHLARALLDAVPKAGIQFGGVLALDGDGVIVEREREKMTKEGQAKEQNDGPRITHKIGHITSPEGLVDAVDEWIGEMEMGLGSRDDQGKSKRANKPVIPVMLVSLHGCGSLSLDVLRAFFIASISISIRTG
ncbi:hypothetical protein BT96DRAFT_416532 [Gymnopus androsaceus JB14]|uniref:Methyltransferase domain-containing protein n=1 Tax=Gymnopus androsaceus JB14 TaxID=1447944 RepID=A0A6A4GV39_9AGAR|nr:hypothetical protein BT96DRAFT_416532 [Gymnopus androsaceus JB14]